MAQLDPNALVLFEVRLSDGCMRGGTTKVFSSTTSLPFLSPQDDHYRRHFRDRIRHSSYVSIGDRRVRRLFRNQQEVESHDGVRPKKHRCGPHSTKMVNTICLYLSQIDHSVCGIDTFESVEEGKVLLRHVSFPSLFPDTGMGRSRSRLSFSALICAHTVP